MSDVPPTNASVEAQVEDQPPNHHRAKSASEIQYEEARVIFNKTIGGHYRHGETGYKEVAALFLTWKDDDMQCKTTEVDKLRELFATQFHFRTDYYEIPSEKWETALHKRVADFCHEFDSSDTLTILYYGGHGYPGEETGEFKLAAKFRNNGDGDPRAFFNDIRTCLRLPTCDQLMIIDCCFAARAFSREHIGKKKFELLASAAHDKKSPAPSLAHSFTRTLTDLLKKLLEKSPSGFCTSQLYRELYHEMPDIKPLLFDQAHHNYGKIWLRPQTPSAKPYTEEEGKFLKLTLRLNKEPDAAIMNELALQLQFLPHVEEVRFEGLYAPRQQIENFMQHVMQAQKLRPLIRRLHARRQLQKALETTRKNDGVSPPTSLMTLHLEHKDNPVYDWSSAVFPKDTPRGSEESRDRRKKSETWPPAQADYSSSTMSLLSDSSFSAETHVDVLPDPGPIFTSRSTSTSRRVNTFGSSTRAQASGTNLEPFTSCSGAYGNAYILAGVAPRAKTDFNKVNGTANGTVLHPVTEDIVQALQTTAKTEPIGVETSNIDPELAKPESQHTASGVIFDVLWKHVRHDKTLHAGQSSQTGGSDDQDQDPFRPDTRSKVYKKPADKQKEYPEIYTIGQEVYVHGRRGSDFNPYRIYKILGSGQYKLTRNGVVENKVYSQADLKTHP